MLHAGGGWQDVNLDHSVAEGTIDFATAALTRLPTRWRASRNPNLTVDDSEITDTLLPNFARHFDASGRLATCGVGVGELDLFLRRLHDSLSLPTGAGGGPNVWVPNSRLTTQQSRRDPGHWFVVAWEVCED